MPPAAEIKPMRHMVAIGLILVICVSCSQNVRHLEPHSGPVVFLGDSLTAGLGAKEKGYVDVLEDRFGLEFVNAGIKGNTTAEGLARLDEDVLKLEPGLVVIQLGGNDALQKIEPEDTFANLSQIIDRIQAKKVPVLLLGIRGGVFSDRFSEDFQTLVKEKEVAYVPNLLKGILTNATLKHDSIHPNDKGYAKIADRIEPTMRRLLKGIGKI